MKLNVLKGKLVENEMDFEALVKPLNVNYSAVLKRMSGQSEFKISEVNGLRKLLKLTDQEVIDIRHTIKTSKMRISKN